MSIHNPPLKPLPLSRSNSTQFNIFYTKEGDIRDKFIPLCEELKISTKDLLIKILQDFAGPNISDKVQTQKFNQYEANRFSKLEFLKTLALERRLIKAKKDKEININEPKSYRSQGVTPRGNQDYREGFSPSLMNTPSNQYLEQIRQDGNKSVAEKKLNFFFTELPDTMTPGNQTNRMRDYVNGSLTPMSLSLEKKKTRQYVTFDKLSTSKKGDKTTRTSRNSSLEQEGMNTKHKFMQNFDKALEERIKKSERMFNASATLLRQQDENRTRLNDMWAKKEEKWQQAMKKLEIKKKGKESKIEEIQRTRSEKRLELHKADEQRRRDKHKMMIRKMNEADKKMEEFQGDQLKRIMEFNKPYRDRQSSYMGKRRAMEEAQIPLLSDIEDRLLNSSMRKQRAISTRSRGTQWFEIEEKSKKARDLEESTKQKTLQKFVEKMVKKKSAFEIHDMIKNRYNSSPRLDKKLEHTARVEAIRAQDVEKVKEKVKETQERLSQGARRVEKHKMEMVEFYKEKREINMYRTEAAKFNKQLVVEADERKTDFRVSMYRGKLKQIEKEKEEMNKRRERVFELTRNLFERRPGGSLG